MLQIQVTAKTGSTVAVFTVVYIHYFYFIEMNIVDDTPQYDKLSEKPLRKNDENL